MSCAAWNTRWELPGGNAAGRALSWGTVCLISFLVLSCARAPLLASPQQDRSPTDRAVEHTSVSTADTHTQRPGKTTANYRGENPRVLANRFEKPQQLLELLDIGPSDLHSFVDGQPITESDEEAFLKVLFRIPQIRLDDVARWVHTSVAWEELKSDSKRQRGEFFLLRGRVVAIAKQPVRGRLAELFEFDSYYVVEIKVDDGPHVTVCARSIPVIWQSHTKLDEPCRVSAMFLKHTAPVGDSPRLLFAASRVEWLPDRPNSILGINSALALLGNLGMDVGLLDTVRTRNGLPISAEERECFYALLKTVLGASPKAIADCATPMRLGPLLQEPQDYHGNVLRFSGSVRRITRVVVRERDIRQRYGITHYYQLDLLVPLKNAEIQMQGSKPDQTGPTYRTNFPFTCCTLTIPDPWEPFVDQEQTNISITVDGFFFKLWAYSNPYVASFGQHQYQLSPMFMLAQPKPEKSARSRNRTAEIAWGIFFLVILAGIWATVWFLSHKDRQQADALLQKRLDPAEPPDFEYLQEHK